MKKILVLWIALAVVLVTGLTIVGFQIKKQNKPYKEIEERLILAGEKYTGEYLFSLESENTIITLNDLKEKNIIDSLDYNCIGYVKVTKKMQILSYKPFISCDKYKTNGFDDSYIKNN